MTFQWVGEFCFNGVNAQVFVEYFGKVVDVGLTAVLQTYFAEDFVNGSESFGVVVKNVGGIKE